LGQLRTFRFQFEVDKAGTDNDFIRRLWAHRKIAESIDLIRQMGADYQIPARDPRVRELVDEMVNLSIKYGVVTEYTKCIVQENSDLSNKDKIADKVSQSLSMRAMATRIGWGAYNQSANLQRYNLPVLNRRNRYFDMHMNRVSFDTVQQINDYAFYFRNNRWIDSRLIGLEGEAKTDEEIEFGTPNYLKLAHFLAGQNRQGCLALKGDIFLKVDDKTYLIKKQEN